MEYNVNSVISLISRIHTQTAEFTNKMLASHNFVSSHGFILFLLSENSEMSMGEIAKKINRDKSTTTFLIRKLIDEKLVKSMPSSKDNRKKIISLTAEGKKYNNFTSEISNKLLSICYKNFSMEEKETLLNLLEKMSLNLEAE
ncbi:MarR family winged helix-turn-helix transcriptional regulator [uncultured Treponema sp.]|uniref:MarR family winged helix-turn-helix transcriptional regulator n=1 Tax=uncultured Treponema sp. TaxID=162155 RepID=UPI0025D8CD28|nr:MarR family winged helix-turn-helix transcriptional regulator [uncultured Treponema sp.]